MARAGAGGQTAGVSFDDRDLVPPSAPVGVVCADDHDAYRNLIAEAISVHEGLALLAACPDGTTALTTVRERQPDVALLDFRMPGLSGLEVCRQIRGSGLSTVVVLLTAVASPQLREAAHRAGAADVLAKETPREAICRAVLALGTRR